MEKIKLGLVDGWHPYQVAPFHELFRSFEDVDYYLQFFENWGFNGPEEYKKYDALCFYNMTNELPPEGDAFRGWVDNAIAGLADEDAPGIVMLHHSILSLPEREDLSEIIGIKNRKFGFHVAQTLNVKIANQDHPITKGLEDFEMMDETYTMDDPKPEDGNEILLTVDHEKSMNVLAWTRMYKGTRVFCLQSGHDRLTWENPTFRTILHRGIQWAAGKC